jgi:hypothetical protein
MIHGPADPGDVGEMATVECENGIRVEMTDYDDGQLICVSWPATTHGSIIADVINKLPPGVVGDGLEWATEGRGLDRRTYAGYWLADG